MGSYIFTYSPISASEILYKSLISLIDSTGKMKLADFGDLKMGQTMENGAGWKATEIIKEPSTKSSPTSDIQVCHQIHSCISKGYILFNVVKFYVSPAYAADVAVEMKSRVY